MEQLLAYFISLSDCQVSEARGRRRPPALASTSRMSFNSASAIRPGLGGHPAMRRSTGRISSSGPASCAAVAEHVAAERAVAERGDEARLGHRLVGAAQRLDHARRDRAGDEQDVGVARRGDDVQAVSLEVVERVGGWRSARARSRCTSRRRRGAARATRARAGAGSAIVAAACCRWLSSTNIALSGPRRRSRARSSC